jgi:hypothetical protein
MTSHGDPLFNHRGLTKNGVPWLSGPSRRSGLYPVKLARASDRSVHLWATAVSDIPAAGDRGIEQFLGVDGGIGGIRGYECPDGNFYYAKPDSAGLWRLPLSKWNSWAVCGDHVVLIIEDQQGSLLLRRDPDSGELVTLARLPGLGASTIALDRECPTCLYTRVERAVGDLMLAEGFHQVSALRWAAPHLAQPD